MKRFFWKNKKASKVLYMLAVFFLCMNFFVDSVSADSLDFKKGSKRIVFQDDGMVFEFNSNAQTVDDFLKEQKIILKENDVIFPTKDQRIFSGSKVIVMRAKKITIKEGGKVSEFFTLQKIVRQAIWENKEIKLGEDDIVVPERNTPVKDGMKVSITHVLIKEEVKNVDIDFKTISNEDKDLGWRVKKVTQKGEVGVKEVRYKVVYNDGKEISRKVLDSKVVKDPVEEIVTQGTFVKTGKASRGQATWYAFKGGLFAASRTIPRGGYAKVTNMDNGSSVIVQINDYGPQAPQRIIDLDKIAFAKIANLGQGVLQNVKVEQVLN